MESCVCLGGYAEAALYDGYDWCMVTCIGLVWEDGQGCVYMTGMIYLWFSVSVLGGWAAAAYI